MNKVWYLFLVLGVSWAMIGSAQAADGTFSEFEQQVGVYGVYQDTDDLDEGYGGGLHYAVFTPVAKPRVSLLKSVDLGLDLRGEYITDLDSGHIDTDMYPIQANLLLRTQFTNGLSAYGGGGVGYVWFDEDDGNLDDEYTYSALVGLDQKITSNLSLFVEGEYMWLEPDDDGRGGDIDMDGFGVNAGINYNF
ncbi:outer membrane beta-barrel protein [Desulfovermiculus halophilus]|uniref:outer membrane beta-barrel protein n=1 Tax=Desulfovermiculus halophilus TaxID=339722 RepID=UPI000480E709|nr:outer membrane beta-barrel protein [Desulfovermiculus halophilus]